MPDNFKTCIDKPNFFTYSEIIFSDSDFNGLQNIMTCP